MNESERRVRVEDDGPVRHLVLDRPDKRNALDIELYRQLHEAVDEAAADPAVRVVLIRGNGPVFSAGNDLDDLARLAANPTQARPWRPLMLDAFSAIEQMPKPTIAVIHGACMGGACELALACDLRVMATEARIGLIEARLGLVPDLGGCSRLPAVVGLGVAKEMVMTGRLLDGNEAKAVGLANRAASADELEAVTRELVDGLLSCGPAATGMAKRILDVAAKPGMDATLEMEIAAQEQLAASADFAEGARATREKRIPQFTGH
jgi:enoyl-CoA hydratase/carnithine racemase